MLSLELVMAETAQARTRTGKGRARWQLRILSPEFVVPVDPRLLEGWRIAPLKYLQIEIFRHCIRKFYSLQILLAIKLF